MKSNIKSGITGKLKRVELCRTGSLKIHVERADGSVSTPLMTKKFPALPAIKSKAESLVGNTITTMVSNTTDAWSAGKFFCDLN